MTRKEAIETIEMAISQIEWDYPIDYVAAFDKAVEILNQPEIVRCKDCKYFPSAPQYEPSCWKHRRRGDDPDWFCADGERRGSK